MVFRLLAMLVVAGRFTSFSGLLGKLVKLVHAIFYPFMKKHLCEVVTICDHLAKGMTMIEMPILSPGDFQKYVFTFRDHKVMVDVYLARMYDTETKKLKQQVKRNRDRFPGDFMFELTQMMQ